MHTAFQIIIPRRMPECQECGAKFEPEQAYHSVVMEAEDGTYQRHDFCTTCWKDKSSQYADQDVVQWQGKVPAKKHERRFEGLNRDEKALAILKELLEQEQLTAEEEAEAFVLGLYLSRQRSLLIRKQISRDSKVFQLYEIAGQEEIIAVPYLNLSDLEVDKVQQRVARRLKD